MTRALSITRIAALLAMLTTLCSCLSDRPLQSRLGSKAERADDAVGFVSVSTPLFTPLDEPVGGDKRLDFTKLASWEKATIDLAAPSFGTEKLTYDLFNLALSVKLATISQTIVENTTRAVGDGSDANQPLVSTSPPDPADDGTKPKTTPNTRSVTRTYKSASVPDAAQPPQLSDTIKLAMAKLLSKDNRTYSLPPDVLATLAASLQTYIVNLEEVYNVDGFDYRHGLSGRYVPYKVHFTVTAEPGWYSRYQQYDAVVEVELSLLKDPCKQTCQRCHDDDSDDIVILHVSPLETAQSITEFAASMAEFGAAVSASGSASSDLAFNAEAQRLSLAAQRLEGARAHKTFTVGFPSSNRIRIRFLADRVGTMVGRDLQPVSRILTATVLVPATAAGRLDARVLATSSRETIKDYCALVKSKKTKGRANEAVRGSLADSLQGIGAQIAKFHPNDPFLKVVFRQAVAAIRSGEKAAHILTPLATLIRQEVPTKIPTDVRPAILALIGHETIRWDNLFCYFKNADADEIRQAFEMAVAPQQIFAPGESPHPCNNTDNAPAAAGLELVRALAMEIRAVGRERFETNDALIKTSLAGNRESERVFVAALTFQLMYRLYLMERAFSDVEAQLQVQSSARKAKLDQERDKVQALLCGARCGLGVKAYFAPTMFGADGGVTPPRDYWLIGTQPPDQRVLAADLKSPRVAPIPPWMGPLDDRLKIISAEGFFTANLADGTLPEDAKDPEAAQRASALRRGRAVVRVTYHAPPMILDAQEKLIHLTDVYARVQGVGPAAARSTCDTSKEPGVCAAGAFCRLLPRENDVVIEVRDVDLSRIVKTDLSEAPSLRAVLQLIVVPKGCGPDDAWVGGTAQVTTTELVLAPQPTAGAAPPRRTVPAKTPTPAEKKEFLPEFGKPESTDTPPKAQQGKQPAETQPDCTPKDD